MRTARHNLHRTSCRPGYRFHISSSASIHQSSKGSHLFYHREGFDDDYLLSRAILDCRACSCGISSRTTRLSSDTPLCSSRRAYLIPGNNYAIRAIVTAANANAIIEGKLVSGGPHYESALLFDPGGTVALCHCSASVLSPAILTTSTPTISKNSNLNHTAPSLTVYAMQDGLPRHFARLASGCLVNLSGWD